jgi:hypothetical protein
MRPFSECHDAVCPRSVAARFYRAALAGATVFFACPASAQMTLDPDCLPAAGTEANCVHVVACIGGETLFVGAATGWEAGRLEGRLSTGALCTGDWDNATASARFTCDDGQAGRVRYLLRDGPTGTAIGVGATREGLGVEAWSGLDLRGYIRRETGEVRLDCGPAALPLS